MLRDNKNCIKNKINILRDKIIYKKETKYKLKEFKFLRQ